MVALALRTGMDAIFSPTPRASGNLRGLGERWRREADGSDTYLEGGVKNREDLARFDLDALAQQWLIQAKSFMDECLQATRGTGLGVAGRVDGPFWLAQLTMGLEASLVAMVEDPDLVVRIMDFYAGYQRELARAIVEKGLPLVLAADDLAHTDGLLVSPAWLERYWFPRMQVILEPLVAAGIPCVFHSCGKLEQVIPLLLRLKCAAIQALQPNCNDIYEVRRRYGKQIALMGNIDITYPLSQGTPEDVRRDVIEHLDRPFAVMKELHRILKPGGKLQVKVPHFSRGFTHAEHAHGFDVTFPLYFNRNFTRSGYMGFELTLDRMELHYIAFIHLLKHVGYGGARLRLVRALDAVVSCAANLNPYLASRLWCFWLGGFDEIEFRFTKPGA